jgi:hypothetical protein
MAGEREKERETGGGGVRERMSAVTPLNGA